MLYLILKLSRGHQPLLRFHEESKVMSPWKILAINLINIYNLSSESHVIQTNALHACACDSISLPH